MAVEDYAANLELLCGCRELHGYRVSQATNGQEAITQATTLQPHLILMDVKMPGIDGLEVTRRLKADPRTKDIPVVLRTAFARAADAGTLHGGRRQRLPVEAGGFHEARRPACQVLRRTAWLSLPVLVFHRTALVGIRGTPSAIFSSVPTAPRHRKLVSVRGVGAEDGGWRAEGR